MGRGSRRELSKLGSRLAVGLVLLMAAAASRAEIATIDVLLDLDQDSATGCVASTVDGDAPGIELRVRTLFDVGTETVTSTTTAPCADPTLGVFRSEVAITGAPLPPFSGVPGNGVLGSVLVETHVPLSVVGASARSRAFVVLTSPVGEDALLAGEAGAPLLVSIRTPMVSALGVLGVILALILACAVVRAEINPRALAGVLLLVSLGTSWLIPARGWSLLGEGTFRSWGLDEWIGADPEADAPAGVDLLAFYAAVDDATGELWLRTDILFGAPVCLAWGTVDPGEGFVCTMQPPLDQGPFGGAVALTFDDGPDPTVTPLILATLRAQGIPATFFVLGDRLVSAEGRALALEIHEDPLFRLANHTASHRRLTELSPEEVQLEVSTASDRIREAIGDSCHFPRYFRFPYGDADCASMGVVRSEGLAVASVHVDPGDWCYGANGGYCPASEIPWLPDELRDDLVANALDRFLASNGGIMLMHDVHAHTAAQLPAILAELQAAGATFVDLADPVLFPIMNEPIVLPEAPACCGGGR